MNKRIKNKKSKKFINDFMGAMANHSQMAKMDLMGSMPFRTNTLGGNNYTITIDPITNERIIS
jgi:hypothetical protein